MNEAGIHKSAVLLLALGEASAAEVLAHLDVREAQQIREAMVNLASVAQAETANVLREFEACYAAQQTPAAPSDTAWSAADEQSVELSDNPVARLAGLSAVVAAQAIRNEPPQAIAAILGQLDRAQATAIVAQLPTGLRDEIALDDPRSKPIQPDALDEIEAAIAEILASRIPAQSPLQETAPSANIDYGAAALLDRLRSDDNIHTAARPLRTFAQIGELDSSTLAQSLTGVRHDSLVIALQGADETLLAKVVAAIGEPGGQQLREAVATAGPARVSDIEREQQELVDAANRVIYADEILDE